MKFKKVKGYVYSRSMDDNRHRVTGYAFQTPGFPWLHLWVTPSIESWGKDRWNVSHWETGCAVNGYSRDTKEEAVEAAIATIKEKGEERTRKAIAAWFEGATC